MFLMLMAVLLLYGCSTNSGSAAQTTTGPLTIATGTLPSGRVGVAYASTLVATGGAAPYTWSITSGSLPAGLSLAASTGVISGVPTAVVGNSSVTFTVSDSGNPVVTQSVTLTISIVAPGAIVITTTSLPAGSVGGAYSATLAASGGTTPYTWSITSGTLPAGLALNAATGAITGTPTAAVTSAPLTFQVQDSSNPVQRSSAGLTISVNPATIAVTITPRPTSVTVTQTISLAATTNDVAGVTWSTSPGGGSFNPTTSSTGTTIFTAPATAGVYVITATSVSDTTKSSSATIGVTDLAGVYSYHNDLARDGANIQEYALTTSNVNTTSFGKLFSCPVDGAIYTQPLWVANLMVNGAKHNVIFVATAHDSLFAFDADANPCQQLWKVSLIDSNHGATSGEATVPSGVPGPGFVLVGSGSGDIQPEVGVTGTPVIDPSSATLYVVSKSVIIGASAASSTFYQRLHAIDLATGNEKSGSPVVIAASFPGTGDGGTIDTFNSRQQNQRAGLALVNGSVYIAWAGHEDRSPFYGWMIRYTYSGSSFTRSSVLNVDPNGGFGGIWMSGAAPSADSSNNLYVITGNGFFDAANMSGSVNDYGDSFLQLSTSLAVSQRFTPTDQLSDFNNDSDFGAGGAAILADLPAGSPYPHLVIGGGKDGYLYVLNRDTMGGATATPAFTYGDSYVLQRINLIGEIFDSAAYWNNHFYIAAVGEPLSSYALNTSTAQFSPGTASALSFQFPGSSPSVSANGTANGIVWALDDSQYCTGPYSPPCGPAILHAYDATNLATELWNSSLVSGDAAGNAVKFTVPAIANGKVYVGTRGNNTGGVFGSTTVSGQLDVYGLKSN